MIIEKVSLFFIDVETRTPLKFGDQVVSEVACARVCINLVGSRGKVFQGWGETPLSVSWVWPTDAVSYEDRGRRLREFCVSLAQDLEGRSLGATAFAFLHDYSKNSLSALRESVCEELEQTEPIPHLARLVCFSLFDIAIHDAYAKSLQVSVFESFEKSFMPCELSRFFGSQSSFGKPFHGRSLDEFFDKKPAKTQKVWHLVGGLDPLKPEDVDDTTFPDDGYPRSLVEWIKTDGLDALKIKLRGFDYDWDVARLKAIGAICREHAVTWLTADFNCTVRDPAYICAVLDELKWTDPETYQRILYIEQPFPYDLKANQIDVHSVSSRKPLFMDESAHDWSYVDLGKGLGWTGVALKTCKTLTGAMLSLAWAKTHGMGVMVQDLTNPMIAQIPHFLLGAHSGTIMGVESNGMQYYPAASRPEECIHPGLFRRRSGMLDGSSLRGDGFGYRIDEIDRELPQPAYETN